jgi:hypothetical protein
MRPGLEIPRVAASRVVLAVPVVGVACVQVRPSWCRVRLAACRAHRREVILARGFQRRAPVSARAGWPDSGGRPSCMLGWRGGNGAGEIRTAARSAPP